jgi:hypothetical protein
VQNKQKIRDNKNFIYITMNKKLKIIFPIIIISQLSFAQLFFSENFEYSDYEIFKLVSENRKRWTFFHSENQDFNNNRMIDSWENIKSIDFVKNEENNTAIRFQLNKMNDKILREDVMKKGEINGEKVDYPNFFTHIARNEISTWDYPGLLTYNPNRKYTFEFEVMIPQEVEFEKENCQNPSKANYMLTGQWHFSQEVLKGKTMAPVSLRVVCGQWMLNLNPLNDSEEKDSDFIPLGNVEKGKWVHWKFEIKFSHKEKGLIKVSKDNITIFNQQKRQTIFSKRTEENKLVTSYFKIGVYKPHWWSRNSSIDHVEVYFRNVRVGR